MLWELYVLMFVHVHGRLWVLTSPKHMHTQFIIDFLRAVEDTKGNNGEKGKVPHTHIHTLTKLGPFTHLHVTQLMVGQSASCTVGDFAVFREMWLIACSCMIV